MEFSVELIIGLIAGGVVGGVGTWWISRARGGAVSVMQLKKENDKFRDEVTEHFVETARLINQMTDSYKQVFDHLSHGAEKLVDNERLAERLPPGSGEEVKLRQFGAAASAHTAGDHSSQAQRATADSHQSSGKAQAKASERSEALKNPVREGQASGQKGSNNSGAAAGTSAEEKSGQPSDDKSGDKSGDKLASGGADESPAGTSADESSEKSDGAKAEDASTADQEADQSRPKD